MIIMGLDPGLQNTGWGVISYVNNSPKYIASGTVISPNAKDPLPKRLAEIFIELQGIIKTYNPAEAAVEETFLNKNPKTTLVLGHARAVSLLAPALIGIPVHEYAANLIKKSVVGKGHASKEQVMMMMNILLPRADFKTDHEADALATAICHAHHR